MRLLTLAAAAAVSLAQSLPLPDLPYPHDSLEPFIDSNTMRVHHLGHHAGYTEKLNALLSKLRSNDTTKHLAKRGIDTLLQQLDEVSTLAGPAVATGLRNQGGGYVNHDLFWWSMSPNYLEKGGRGGQFDDQLPIVRALQLSGWTYESLKTSMSDAGLSLFGSGWVWLEADLRNVTADMVAAEAGGEEAQRLAWAGSLLRVTTTINQDTPAMVKGRVPLLGLDVWEHAYYLKHANKRGNYIGDWWNVVCWPVISQRFEAVLAHLVSGGDPLETAHLLSASGAKGAAAGHRAKAEAATHGGSEL